MHLLRYSLTASQYTCLCDTADEDVVKLRMSDAEKLGVAGS